MFFQSDLDRVRILGSVLFILVDCVHLVEAEDRCAAPADPAEPGQRFVELYDDFEDGELLDGDPVNWNGRLTRAANGHGGYRRIRDGWLQTWNTGARSIETTATEVFRGDVSVRTLVRTVGEPATFFNLIAHASDPNNCYVGTTQDRIFGNWAPGAFGLAGPIGNAAILRIDAVNAPAVLASTWIEDFDPAEEHLVQLDVRGECIELRVWRPGEEFPEEPLLCARDTRYRSGEAGVFSWNPPYRRGNGVTDYLECDFVWMRDSFLGADDVPPPGPMAGARFRRGDCNEDGGVDISDVSCALNWLFTGGAAPGCLAALNVNADETTDIADPVSLLNFLFGNGPIITSPFPECGAGTKPADEDLGCETGCQ